MEEGQDPRLTPALPVMLDLAGRLVVVVGAGAVGIRKAAAALAAGAAVKVVDPILASGGRQPPDSSIIRRLTPPARQEATQLVPELYQPHHLDGARLVFACATPEVNVRVVADARSRNIWVNSATDPAAGDFALPSVVRVGDLTLAVSTGGAAPALARRVREKREAEFDASFAEWVRVLGEVRAVVLAEVADAARRRELLDAFADWPWLARLRAEGSVATKAAMLAVIEASRGT